MKFLSSVICAGVISSSLGVGGVPCVRVERAVGDERADLVAGAVGGFGTDGAVGLDRRTVRVDRAEVGDDGAGGRDQSPGRVLAGADDQQDRAVPLVDVVVAVGAGLGVQTAQVQARPAWSTATW
jgi:hypothetical protein